MIEAGLIALGIVATMIAQFGLVAWVCRGHRADLRGVRIVRSDEWQGGRVGLSQVFPPTQVEISRPVPKEPDYYDMSRERGGDE